MCGMELNTGSKGGKDLGVTITVNPKFFPAKKCNERNVKSNGILSFMKHVFFIILQSFKRMQL